MAHHFAARTTWTGSRSGPIADYASYSREHEVEVAGKPKILLSSDPAFRGDANLLNPEDLMVASLSSCHMLSYLALCARRGVQVAGYVDEAEGRMEVRDGVLRFVEVTLHPIVTIGSGDLQLAESLHEQAHHECFIAASVNFPVECRPIVRTEAA